MRTGMPIRLEEGDAFTSAPGLVDVNDATGKHGFTIYGSAEELEELAAQLKTAAALDRTRRGQAQQVARAS